MCDQNVYLTARQRELKNTSSAQDIRKQKPNVQELSYDKYRHSRIGAHVLKNSGPRNAHSIKLRQNLKKFNKFSKSKKNVFVRFSVTGNCMRKVHQSNC